MKKEIIGSNVTVYLGDSAEILPMLGIIDAVVTDPPYGIGEAAGKAKTRTSGFTSKLKNAHKYQRDYGDDAWDDEPVSDDLIELIRKISRYQIIFGGNYYHLPPTSCWLVWDKLNGDTDFADCELAWTNLPKAVRKIEWLWNGAIRKGSDIREHPTQKPLGVMAWILDQLPDGVKQVCDPFMGSGTTGLAAIRKGVSFIGIEREPKYFEIACKRLSEAFSEPMLFDWPNRADDQLSWGEMWSKPFDKPELIAGNGADP